MFVAIGGVLPLAAACDCSAFPILGRCPVQTWVAAEAAAAGALPRNVVIIFPLEDPFLSLPSFRNVLSIPPFFSGLGVLDPLRELSPGGTRPALELFCRLLARGATSLELFLAV